ncbi:MAG: serine acetyltransferase [Prevotella sp.]|jgi:serine O-acetyltransferase|nr:serine acetyltransferase [Prevotella sp.]
MDQETFQKAVNNMATRTEVEKRMMPKKFSQMPTPSEVQDIARLVKTIVFPGFFDNWQSVGSTRAYHIGVDMEQLYNKLKTQIALAMLYKDCNEVGGAPEETCQCRAEALTDKFFEQLPEIKRLLYTDVEAIYDNDPAVTNYSEVIFSYPIVETMVHYRVAHVLWNMGVPVIPRILTEQAHSQTGIDIHPGATIGEYFAIDHGTGVVIGETCIIGKHVTLYQGVTLGAKNFTLDGNGHPINIPRHPIIEDNVTVYSNATLLGRITIGHDTIIGGNIWVTYSVPPRSKILQSKPKDATFTGGLGI